MEPPVGIVTMLFSDIEGSTKLAQELGQAWPGVLTEHRHLIREAITKAGGYIEGTEGDSFFATFVDADVALQVAIDAQRALRRHVWPDAIGELRVRMGLHTGGVEYTDGHYVGIEVHRGARIGAAASGGQVLVSDATRAAIDTTVVTEDLGWHRLKDFPDPIRLFHVVVDRDRTASEFPPPKTLDIRPTNLPPTDRPLIGRAAELYAVTDEFISNRARLVTLTGLGGVGKTTLALSAARSLLDTCKGGVWVVRAEALETREELLQAVGAAIRVRDVPGVDALTAIAERLDSGRFLLVLDNLEHLVDAPLLVADLLGCAPGLSILATSRAPLRLESERAITIGPMGSDDAVEMFASRARVVDPSFRLDDPETRDAVAELCGRLGYLPLALELAAARLRLMTPRQLLQRLGTALDLRGSEPDRPERQRSVRATIEWTLGLLPDDAERLFARLGVFAGTPSLDVIEIVCGDGIDVVESAAVLVDYSLLQKSGAGLELVEALREVAGERLAASDEEASVRRAHAEAMIVLGRGVRSAATAPKGTLEQMDAMLADTWAAARWARGSDAAIHRALVANLGSWWVWKGSLRTTLTEIDTALSAADLKPAERGELLVGRAYVLMLVGRYEEALSQAEEGIALAEHRSDLDRGGDLHVLANALMVTGHVERSIETGQLALEHHRRAGDRERTVLSLANLAQAFLQMNDLASAGAALDEAEALAAGLDTMAATGLPNIRADWSILTGEPGRALEGFAQSLSYSIAEMGQLALYDIAGVVLALERLGVAESALELAAALETAAAEWGTDVTVLSFIAGGVPGAAQRARESCTPDEAAAADARGRAIAPNDVAGHALAIAREALAVR